MSEMQSDGWRGFRARFAGKCSKCEQAVRIGDPVRWSKRHRGVIYHAQCFGEGPTPRWEPIPQQTPE